MTVRKLVQICVVVSASTIALGHNQAFKQFPPKCATAAHSVRTNTSCGSSIFKSAMELLLESPEQNEIRNRLSRWGFQTWARIIL